MGLSGKIVREIEIVWNGDVLHEIFREKTHEIADMSPAHIQGVDLLSGKWGTVGSVIVWRYTDHDGNQRTAEEVIEEIDLEKKTVVFKVIGGDLLEKYKRFKFIYNGKTEGENHVVTWTIEFEKLRGDVEDPNWMMDLCVNVTKDIQNHHLQAQ